VWSVLSGQRVPHLEGASTFLKLTRMGGCRARGNDPIERFETESSVTLRGGFAGAASQFPVIDTSKRRSCRFEESVHDRIEMITSMGQLDIG
jgi:hypothetical protein